LKLLFVFLKNYEIVIFYRQAQKKLLIFIIKKSFDLFERKKKKKMEKNEKHISNKHVTRKNCPLKKN